MGGMLSCKFVWEFQPWSPHWPFVPFSIQIEWILIKSDRDCVLSEEEGGRPWIKLSILDCVKREPITLHWMDAWPTDWLHYTSHEYLWFDWNGHVWINLSRSLRNFMAVHILTVWWWNHLLHRYLPLSLSIKSLDISYRVSLLITALIIHEPGNTICQCRVAHRL